MSFLKAFQNLKHPLKTGSFISTGDGFYGTPVQLEPVEFL